VIAEGISIEGPARMDVRFAKEHVTLGIWRSRRS
jgi:hypothetical protein